MANQQQSEPTAFVVLDQTEIARRTAERQMQEQAERAAMGGPGRLDETVPGGKTQRADGLWQDAHGRLVDEASGEPITTEAAGPAALPGEGGPAVTDARRAGAAEPWLDDMEAQRAASAKVAEREAHDPDRAKERGGGAADAQAGRETARRSGEAAKKK